MRKYVLICFVLFLQVAAAHGPTPQKMEEEIIINADINEVWKLISDFQSIDEWHPLVEAAKGEGNNVSAERTLSLKGKEGTIVDSLDEYEEKEHYIAYRLLQENKEVIPASFYTMKIELSENHDNKVDVIWSARFYRADTGNFPPAEYSDEAAVNALKQFARQGLDALKERLEQK